MGWIAAVAMTTVWQAGLDDTSSYQFGPVLPVASTITQVQDSVHTVMAWRLWSICYCRENALWRINRDSKMCTTSLGHYHAFPRIERLTRCELRLICIRMRSAAEEIRTGRTSVASNGGAVMRDVAKAAEPLLGEPQMYTNMLT